MYKQTQAKSGEQTTNAGPKQEEPKSGEKKVDADYQVFDDGKYSVLQMIANKSLTKNSFLRL
jgi:type IV secretory pathway VirB9-like protein